MERKKDIVFRVNQAELERINQDANKQGISRSEYIRKVLLSPKTTSNNNIDAQINKLEELISTSTQTISKAVTDINNAKADAIELINNKHTIKTALNNYLKSNLK